MPETPLDPETLEAAAREALEEATGARELLRVLGEDPLLALASPRALVAASTKVETADRIAARLRTLARHHLRQA